MGLSILKNALDGWADLSYMPNEGLVCYQDEDIFVITKIHTHNLEIGIDGILNSYMKRLESETSVEACNDQVWRVDGVEWKARCLTLDGPMARYTVFVYAGVDGLLCSMEVTLMELCDLKFFKHVFGEFVRNLDFRALYSESAVLSLAGHDVVVTGISDVCLQAGDENTFLFVGKSKYFAVTAHTGFNRKLLSDAEKEFDLKLLSNEGGVVRYSIKQRNGLHGIVELYTLSVGTGGIEVLGYYLSDQNTGIFDNLCVEVKERGYVSIA